MNCDLEIPSRVVHCERVIVPDVTSEGKLGNFSVYFCVTVSDRSLLCSSL